MNIENVIRKRINSFRIIKDKVTEINITPYESKMLGGIKRLDGVRLNIVEPNEEQLDCFAYEVKENRATCTALKGLYCKNEKCRFYRNDITKQEIERSIRINCEE